MPQPSRRQSRLFAHTLIEPIEELEESMEKAFAMVQASQHQLNPQAAYDRLVELVSQGHGESVSLGLFYGILVEPANAPGLYRTLCLVAKDNCKFAIGAANQIIMEKYFKLLEPCQAQVLWFFREAIGSEIPQIESVGVSLMRNILGGDVSPRCLSLIGRILEILEANIAWLYRVPTFVPAVLFTYLRLVAEHTAPQLDELRKRETEFCTRLLTERFDDCAILGRELVRLLLPVARMPQFEHIWHLILAHPQTLAPGFQGLQSLLTARTPRRFIIGRLSYDLERFIHHVLTQVKQSSRKRYLDYLQKQFLNTGDSGMLRLDVVRFVCAVDHPSNDILSSDIVQRWFFLSWIITHCGSPAVLALLKLCLFFDWYFFNPDQDSIMNVEAAILLLSKGSTHMARGLLDFLCRSLNELFPTTAMRAMARTGVVKAIQRSAEVRVVPTVAAVFECVRQDRDLAALVCETLPEFAPVVQSLTDRSSALLDTKPELPGGGLLPVPSGGDAPLLPPPVPPPVTTTPAIAPPTTIQQPVVELEEMSEPDFSDEDEPVSSKKSNKSSKSSRESTPGLGTVLTLEDLDPVVRVILEELRSSEGNEYTQVDAVQKLILAILQKDDFDESEATVVAEELCGHFKGHFELTPLPEDYDRQEEVENSLQKPLFVIFRNFCLTPEDDPSRNAVLLLLSRMTAKEPRMGYQMLYFLKASNSMGDKLRVYRELHDMCDHTLDKALVQDMDLCQQLDFRLFGYLLPDVYVKLANVALTSTELMRLVVGTIDAWQVQDFVAKITTGQLKMFKKESFMSLLEASLDWETIEQVFLWQLISAEDIPLEWILPILPRLQYPKHSEAATGFLVTMRRTEPPPSAPLLRALLNRPSKNPRDLLTVAALRILFDVDEDKLVEQLASLLIKALAAENSATSQRGKAKGPSLDLVLGHLDVYRQQCKDAQNFFRKEVIETNLRDVQAQCSEFLKTKYSDLFSIICALDVLRSGKARRVRRTVSSAPRPESDSDSSTDGRSPKKRRLRRTVDSDSD